MLWEGLTATRDLGRVYELASILVRYGFGDMVRRLGLAKLLAGAGRVLPLGHIEASVALPAPVRVRRALEEMGPSFVKMGQILATRVDLFAPEWIAEFGKLQSQAPAAAPEAIRKQLLEDLGAPPEEVFLQFDPAPLAAASIAQVHRARLHDGTEVVVKVRRPGIRPTVEADLRLLQRAAQAIEARFPELRQFQPTGMVRQFKASLTRELDLAAECRHAERIAASFIDNDQIVVPRVHWDYTGPRMNVQDFVDGIPVSDLAMLDAAGLDCGLVARRGAQTVLKMMFEDGFFHADPHAGNVFVLPGNRIGLIDYGMVGRLSDSRRAQVVGLLDALVRRDSERVTDMLLEWSGAVQVDEAQLAQDIDGLVDHYHGVPLGQLDLVAMLMEVTALLRANQLVLPADLALMIKVFVTLEGLGRKLDPDFDMAGEAEPFLRRAMLARYAPGAVARDGLRVLSDTAGILSVLPRDLRRLLRTARGGNLKLRLDVDHLQRFGTQIDHSANRLTVGVVLAALIIGSSIALTVDAGPTLLGLPAFGLLGFLGAAIAGAWLVLSIWRSGGGK
ncbi:ABC1 kinase family protein [Lysobacter sp. A286]